MDYNKFLDAMYEAIDRRVAQLVGNRYIYARWNGSESVDANLSSVTPTGSTEAVRYCPKLSHVTGLTAGDTVLCIKDRGIPLTIIGRPVGDITLAT